MSAGQKRRDDRNNGWYMLIVLILTGAAWYYAVNMVYTIPKEKMWWAYFYALMATLGDIRLWLPPLLAFLFGLAIVVNFYVYYGRGFNGGDFISKLRGPSIVSQAELADITRERGTKQLSLMGIPVPTSKENQHFSAVGSTGTGKSQVIGRYIESAHARKERTICIDPNGGFMEKFFQSNDSIFNPFDARTQASTNFN